MRFPLLCTLSLLVLSTFVACRGCGGPAPTKVRGDPVVVAPLELSFGTVWVGGTADQHVDVTNPNAISLSLNFDASVPFAVIDGPASLAAGTSVPVTIRFTSDAGSSSGSLYVNEVQVTLHGAGEPPPQCAPSTTCVSTGFDFDAGTCLSRSRPDGTDCTGSSSCFLSAQCNSGICVGSATTCDDHNACTMDVCTSTGCVHIDALPLCPVSDPCQLATCDSDAGCGQVVALDGTSCGSRTCSSAHICINGQCVVRTLPNPTCPPAECEDAGCGAVALQDGGFASCGTCTAPTLCSASLHQCVSVSEACADAGAQCGTLSDSCGFPVQCPDTCGTRTCLGNVCGVLCVPISCAQAGAQCGPIGDGCGGLLFCGSCDGGTCGGSGVPNVCPACTHPAPPTCATAHRSCGPLTDTCGAFVTDCGTCPASQPCLPTGQCSTPLACQQLGVSCGLIRSACGPSVDCGPCDAGICDWGTPAAPHLCLAPAQPTDCPSEFPVGGTPCGAPESCSYLYPPGVAPTGCNAVCQASPDGGGPRWFVPLCF